MFDLIVLSIAALVVCLIVTMFFAYASGGWTI
jgi:hypothetical protein